MAYLTASPPPAEGRVVLVCRACGQSSSGGCLKRRQLPATGCLLPASPSHSLCALVRGKQRRVTLPPLPGVLPSPDPGDGFLFRGPTGSALLSFSPPGF